MWCEAGGKTPAFGILWLGRQEGVACVEDSQPGEKVYFLWINRMRGVIFVIPDFLCDAIFQNSNNLVGNLWHNIF